MPRPHRNIVDLVAGTPAVVPRPDVPPGAAVRVSVYAAQILDPALSLAWQRRAGGQAVIWRTGETGLVAHRVLWPEEADLSLTATAACTVWVEWESALSVED